LGRHYVIGLTGNIASGKSAVSHMLADLGAFVVDADAVAHEVLQPGTEETAAIARHFGNHVLAADGSVDRASLSSIVFADRAAMAALEAIVHPGTRKRILERVESAVADVAVIEAIKLIEGPLVDHVDAVWVVTSPREVRIARLMADRGMSRDAAEQRVDAQNPEDEKVRRADVVLRNDGTIEELRGQVDAAWQAIPRRRAASEL